SNISAIAFNNLKKHVGFKHPTRVYDVIQQLAQPDDEVLDQFNIDIVDNGRAFNTEDSDWYDVQLADGSKAQYPSPFRPEQQSDGSWIASATDGTPLAKMPAGGTFFDQLYFPYLDGYPSDYQNLSADIGKAMWAAFAISPWDHINEKSFWTDLREKTLTLRQSSDRAIMMGAGCNLFEWGTFLRRLDNFLMDLVTQPAEVERFLDALMELHLSVLEKICRSVGDIADLVRFGDDLGMDNGPFMAPEVYRKLFKPRHRQLCEYVKKNSQMHTYLHSCGSIYKLIPDLIEAGFEVVNPVQTNCRDMEPERLKRQFGKDITFWGGGCDTRHVLNRATPAQVKKHVLERMEILSPGGGFVFTTVHNILPEVPPENVVAVFEAVKEFNDR
ncbi:MAG: methyltransferase, partial [Planctomycetota bacterium]